MKKVWLRHRASTLVIGMLGFSAANGFGCALLSSSSDSSDSASSISESFSDSSSSSNSSSDDEDAEDAALRQDVRTYTALFTETEGDVDAYLSGIGAVCERHAVSRWQADAGIQRAIGEGLAQSGWAKSRMSEFAARVAGDDLVALATMRAATEAVR